MAAFRPPDRPDLHQHIRTQPGGTLGEADAARYFAHVLSALRHAHGRGFLHSDVKPANVRLDRGCTRAVLVDWGMTRLREHHSPCSPWCGTICAGTPAYASPEQLTGHNVGSAWGSGQLGCTADVWSLGATLVEMVTGSPPFTGDNFEALVANVLRLNYCLPDELSVDVRQLVDQMLQLNPNDRASTDDLCAEPWVLASGALLREDGADGAPSRGGAAGIGDLECAECDEVDDSSGKAKRGRRPSAADAAAGGGSWRRLGMYALYAAVLYLMLLSHRRWAPAAGQHAGDEEGGGSEPGPDLVARMTRHTVR